MSLSSTSVFAGLLVVFFVFEQDKANFIIVQFGL